MSSIRRLSSDTFIYGLGSVLPRTLNFFLFIIHTDIFRPDEYGVYTYAMSIVGILNVVYSFGMETAYFRYCTKGGYDKDHVFRVSLTIVAFVSLVLSIALLTVSSFGTHESKHFTSWIALIMFIDNIVAIPFAKLRLENKRTEFAILKISNVIIFITLNAFFLYYNYDPAFGIQYIFLSNVIANAMYLIYFRRSLLTWRPKYDLKITPAIIKYSFPLVITGLAGMTNEFFSRLALEFWLPANYYAGRTSDYALGIFGACYKFSIFMNLAVQSFKMAAEPFYFSQSQGADSREIFAKVNHYFVIVTSLVLIAVIINIDLLKIVFLRKPDYWVGLDIVPPLLLGYMFLGVYYNFSVWFKLTDKTFYGTIITVAGMLLTIVLNYLIVPILGYYGSSLVTPIVYGAMMISCYYLGQRYYPIPYTIGKDLLYLISALAVIYFAKLIHSPVNWLSLVINISIMAVYATGIILIERQSYGRKKVSEH